MKPKSLKNRLRHYLNPLHVYCRLVSILKPFGVSRQAACAISQAYEKFFYAKVMHVNP